MFSQRECPKCGLPARAILSKRIVREEILWDKDGTYSSLGFRLRKLKESDIGSDVVLICAFKHEWTTKVQDANGKNEDE